MKAYVRSACIAAALLCGAGAFAAESGKISSEQLAKRIDSQDSSLVIVDVRSPEEFAAGHIPGAINIPHTHFPARIADLPAGSEQDVVVYCEIGARSEKAISTLRRNGYSRLLHLDGDIKQWKAESRALKK